MSGINFTSVQSLAQPGLSAKISSGQAQQSFSDLLGSMLHKVNQSQAESNLATEKLATGKLTDLNQVMIAAEKASITLQTTVEVRNKVVEAYQEIMRTQI